MKKNKKVLVGILVAFCLILWAMAAPSAWRVLHPARDNPSQSAPDIKNGRLLFLAGDCATCHASPGKPDELLLGGGRLLNTGFGTFDMPNISPDPKDGIGSWTLEQFIVSMREGVLPHKGNAYPAFPYTSYQYMTADDLRDLFAYLKTLPPVQGAQADHNLKFPFTIRHGVGLWRQVFLAGAPLPDEPDKSVQWLRGRYLVEGPGHCVECHSPRNMMGAIPIAKRFAGGPNAQGTGYVPNITPDETGIDFWSANDIAIYLKKGTSPIGIPAGGDMKEVVHNTARLSDEDLLAMATYLKSLPPVDAPNAGLPEPNRTEKIVFLPDNTKTSTTSRLDVLASSGSELSNASVLYVVSTKGFYVEKPVNGAAAPEDGKLLGAAKLSVVGRDGELLQVRLNGWQQVGSGSALYARQGQRILQAVLSDKAAAKVAHGNRMHDAATGQDWQPGELTVWIRNDGLGANLDQLWRYSHDLMGHACATCHAQPNSEDFLANQWIGTLGAMKHFTSLDDDQYRMLLAWLQYHSKDVDSQTLGSLQ